MGAEACGCKEKVYDSNSNTFKLDPSTSKWAELIYNDKLVGVEALHSQNMDIINEAIDAHNICAIHVVIQNQQYDILDYFLSQNFDINVQDTKYGNTALHLAAQNGDTNAIQKLFSYDGIDDGIRNYEGKDAAHVCSETFKRNYIKTKQRGIAMAIANRRRREQKKRKQNGFCYVHTATIQNEMDGVETGIDIDEIAMFLEKSSNIESICNKVDSGKGEITKEKEIEKVIFAVCKLAARDKEKTQNGEDSYDQAPSKSAVRELSGSICNILRDNNGEIHINKNDFYLNLHTFLYSIHKTIIHKAP